MTHTIAYRFDLAADYAGEPRVLDLDVGEALGFDRPRVIRELIDRNYQELQRYGALPRHTANLGPHGGRPSFEYRLNEAQALLLATLSKTSRAADIRQALITTFLTWREGKTVPVRPHHRRPPMGAVLTPLGEAIEAAYDARIIELQRADSAMRLRILARALARLDVLALEPKTYRLR